MPKHKLKLKPKRTKQKKSFQKYTLVFVALIALASLFAYRSLFTPASINELTAIGTPERIETPSKIDKATYSPDCYRVQVKCVMEPCEPVLVCPSSKPLPISTAVPISSSKPIPSAPVPPPSTNPFSSILCEPVVFSVKTGSYLTPTNLGSFLDPSRQLTANNVTVKAGDWFLHGFKLKNLSGETISNGNFRFQIIAKPIISDMARNFLRQYTWADGCFINQDNSINCLAENFSLNPYTSTILAQPLFSTTADLKYSYSTPVTSGYSFRVQSVDSDQVVTDCGSVLMTMAASSSPIPLPSAYVPPSKPPIPSPIPKSSAYVPPSKPPIPSPIPYLSPIAIPQPTVKPMPQPSQSPSWPPTPPPTSDPTPLVSCTTEIYQLPASIDISSLTPEKLTQYYLNRTNIQAKPGEKYATNIKLKNIRGYDLTTGPLGLRVWTTNSLEAKSALNILAVGSDCSSGYPDRSIRCTSYNLPISKASEVRPNMFQVIEIPQVKLVTSTNFTYQGIYAATPFSCPSISLTVNPASTKTNPGLCNAACSIRNLFNRASRDLCRSNCK